QGLRLRSAIDDRPKVLAPVAGRPFLACLLDQLVVQGCRRAVIATGYRGEQVESAFGPRYGNLSLRYSREPRPLGTAGAIRPALLGRGLHGYASSAPCIDIGTPESYAEAEAFLAATHRAA